MIAIAISHLSIEQIDMLAGLSGEEIVRGYPGLASHLIECSRCSTERCLRVLNDCNDPIVNSIGDMD